MMSPHAHARGPGGRKRMLSRRQPCHRRRRTRRTDAATSSCCSRRRHRPWRTRRERPRHARRCSRRSAIHQPTVTTLLQPITSPCLAAVLLEQGRGQLRAGPSTVCELGGVPHRATMHPHHIVHCCKGPTVYTFAPYVYPIRRHAGSYRQAARAAAAAHHTPGRIPPTVEGARSALHLPRLAMVIVGGKFFSTQSFLAHCAACN